MTQLKDILNYVIHFHSNNSKKSSKSAPPSKSLSISKSSSSSTFFFNYFFSYFFSYFFGKIDSKNGQVPLDSLNNFLKLINPLVTNSGLSLSFMILRETSATLSMWLTQVSGKNIPRVVFTYSPQQLWITGSTKCDNSIKLSINMSENPSSSYSL